MCRTWSPRKPTTSSFIRPGTGIREPETGCWCSVPGSRFPIMTHDEPEPIAVPIERELDLHAFAPRDIPSVVDSYIEAAHDAGLSEVRLIHGRGKGVQRGIVQNVLEHHPLVAEFWDDHASHLGATVARLMVPRSGD